MPYLIDSILPSQRLNLVGGLSNSGKTRWVLPMALAWSQGLPIMGYQSNPAPWCYVAGDRLLVEAEDTMRTMGINPATVRTIPAFGPHDKGLLQIMMAAAALMPPPELIVIEGFGDLADDPGRKKQIREFCSRAAAYCQPSREFPNGTTILGVMETPKQKPMERYIDPRQRISGAAGWGYHSSTVFMIDMESFDSKERRMSVSTKNVPSFGMDGRFDALGRLQFP